MKRRRTRVPRANGVFRVIGGLADSHYLKPEHKRRYRYVTLAHEEDLGAPDRHTIECIVINRYGILNPGTQCHPVPIRIEDIGVRIEPFCIY